ncbi:MAG TPA: YidC/Oxa1 family membrane protein insertase [Candidatus Limnocylindrales bacterium]
MPVSTRHSIRPILLVLALVVVALVVAGCGVATGSPAPGASGAASHAPTAAPTPLVPASPGADPVSLLAWIFTPVFQALFILLVGLYVAFHTAGVPGAVAVAIIVMTLIIRAIIIPLFRQQTVSQKRMQLLQPEIREINRRYKGDRTRASEATMALYKERGVNPAAGCLPSMLQMVLLIPMYTVIRDGLTNYNPTGMLKVFGSQIIPLTCPTTPSFDAQGAVKPCIDTVVPWLGNLPVGKPEIVFPLPLIGGLSILALIAALLQLVQSRMIMPPADEHDSSANVQRQTMVLFPLISIVYGGFLPAGLFIYWIVATIFSIVQQYLIVGWGSLFPLFGWYPAFAQGHTPRFPVTIDRPTGGGQSLAATRTSPEDRAAAAASTVRPHARGGRQGRRGRRR